MEKLLEKNIKHRNLVQNLLLVNQVTRNSETLSNDGNKSWIIMTILPVIHQNFT